MTTVGVEQVEEAGSSTGAADASSDIGFDPESELQLSNIQRDVEKRLGLDVVVIIEMESPGVNVGKFMFTSKQHYAYVPVTIMTRSAPFVCV